MGKKNYIFYFTFKKKWYRINFFKDSCHTSRTDKTNIFAEAINLTKINKFNRTVLKIRSWHERIFSYFIKFVRNTFIKRRCHILRGDDGSVFTEAIHL